MSAGHDEAVFHGRFNRLQQTTRIEASRRTEPVEPKRGSVQRPPLCVWSEPREIHLTPEVERCRAEKSGKASNRNSCQALPEFWGTHGASITGRCREQMEPHGPPPARRPAQREASRLFLYVPLSVCLSLCLSLCVSLSLSLSISLCVCKTLKLRAQRRAGGHSYHLS